MVESQEILNEKKRYFKVHTLLRYKIEQDNLNSRFIRINRFLLVELQYNTINVYCENTLSYNNGVHSQTGPKSGSVKASQLILQVFHKHKKVKVAVVVTF